MKSDNLDFLRDADNEDLRTLCDIITKDKDGKFRYLEQLSSKDVYKFNYPKHMKNLVPYMIDELERFGGNTIANVLRGNGVPHREILHDVAQKYKVSFDKYDSDEKIENELLSCLLKDTAEKMSDRDFKNLMGSMGIKTDICGKAAAIGLAQAAIRAGGFQSYIWLVTIANSISRAFLDRGLALAANAALTRYVAYFAGPVGIVISLLLTALDLAGPAYRVTMPAIIQIAYIRSKRKFDSQEVDDFIKFTSTPF